MKYDFTNFYKVLINDVGISTDKGKKFIGKLEEFCKFIEIDLKYANSSETLEIISFLATFKQYFCEKNEWENLIVYSLKNIQCFIYNFEYHPLFIYEGLTHIAFVINELKKIDSSINRFQNKLNEILLTNIARYLEIYNRFKDLNTNNFEFIYGLSGVLRYILEFDHNAFKEIGCQIVDLLLKHTETQQINDCVVPPWFYKPSVYELSKMNTDAPYGILNYGVSHGIGGPLIVLSLAYKKNIYNKETLKKVVNGLFKEYNKHLYYINDIVYWPNYLTINQYIGSKPIRLVENQLSWCYGSIGILRAIYLSATNMLDYKRKKFAALELEKMAKLSHERYKLCMPIVCHGFASVVSIMSEMYNDTHNISFQEASYIWIRKLVDNINSADFNYKELDRKKKVYKYSYLEGYSGIFQTIHAAVFLEQNEHKKRILMI